MTTRKLKLLSSLGLGLNAFCSVLFGFRKCYKINYIACPHKIPGISVPSIPGISLSHFCSINSIKLMKASDLLRFLYGAETYRCPSSAPCANDTRLPLAHLQLRGGAYDRSIRNVTILSISR